MFLLRDDIGDIAKILLDGGTLCYPTDTIWAIGCDATNEAAVARIAHLKSAAPQQGYVLLVSSIAMLRRYVPLIPPRLETLLAHHARPLTIIYAEHSGIPAWVCAADGSVAIRVAQDEFCQQLVEMIDRPLVSTAAAVDFGHFPATFGGISSDILGGVDYVVKHRQDDKNPAQPSSVARLDQYQELEFIRE
jgi:L-threonylcarbamoyladenylate synthase